jgi:transcriptional regulator with XRE-family HTH domain
MSECDSTRATQLSGLKYHYKLTPTCFLDAVDRGLTQSQIAREFGVTRQAVNIRAKKYGLIERLRTNANALKKPAPLKKYETKYGLPIELVRHLQAIGATRAYGEQRSNAKHRGIPWEFTFATWWAMWDASGKWESRGRGKGLGDWVMSRPGDVGPYSPSNVVIVPQQVNLKDVHDRLRARRAASKTLDASH